MARSRNIKPGFFKNADLADKGPLAHLLFAGLWTIADREGRLKDDPRWIRVECLPYYILTDKEVDELLDSLAKGDDPFIVRYIHEGKRVLQVVKWHEHQTPHHKEAPSKLPSIRQARPKLDPSLPQAPESGIRNQESEKRESENQESERNPFEVDRDRFTEAWNSAPGVSPISVMSAGRVSLLKARLAEHVVIAGEKLPWLDGLIRMLSEKFPLKLTRGDPSGWKPDAQWILKPDSLPAIIEGKYDWEKQNGKRRNDPGAGQLFAEGTETRPPSIGWR